MFKHYTIETRSTFRKEEKLKSRKLIELLFSNGVSFSNFPFRIIYRFVENNDSPLQAGFAVSTKNFKKAVDRNRVKRLMREAYRTRKNDLKQLLKNREKFIIIFFIYTGNDLPVFSDVEEKIATSLKRLYKIADEVIAPDT